MEEEFLSMNDMIPDLDSSFTSSTTSSSSFATSATFSARSSLSISLPSFSSSSPVEPHPHSRSSAPSPWSAINTARSISPDGQLHLRHLHLLRHLGTGHLARVFQCRLKGSADADFALKVVDLRSQDDALAHVRAEARALAALDHPFLPTLYARLDASHYACFLIDYCSGGDLHALLRRRPGGRLPVAAARFYAAEVLLALEYLHALGFVYRDLKPENVLLRADGHVMLSDFDLAFHSPVSPSLHRRHRRKKSDRGSTCSCLGGHVGGVPEEEDDDYEEVEFVAEPEAASSKDCVGTHEYLAPEVVSGNGHGNGVDWWAFGIFLYELLYGRTPFKGPSKEATLRNVLNPDKEVRFPHLGGDGGADLAKARDLISRLLERDPRRRMGAKLGAAEIKRHPLFAGIDWALIRCVAPPVVTAAGGAQEGKKQVKWGSWNNLNGRSSKRRRGFFF
ncbi:serine/threonine-protein kinase WAG2-like [Typha latifolia]|uniref:serine/threonine-protein kinase WAG2-like n=1 Tax=Typha latifolia TaxID=4733 RepID=UPI003C2AAF17